MKHFVFIILSVVIILKAQQDDSFINGVDVSFIPQVEDNGGIYYKDGLPADPIEIFRQSEVNYIRLRLWHTPPDGYCGLAKTVEMAGRIKQSGLKFLLNFHYSDTWADPGNQEKPAAWQSLSYQELLDSVYTYTFNVIREFDSANALPDMVQIGNEIIGGMLWNDGRVNDSYNTSLQWQRFTTLLKTAIDAVKDAAPDTTIPIMIHIDRGGDNIESRWFFDNLNTYEVSFDIIGLSFYPWWHGNSSDLEQNVNDLASRYNKDIIVVETAYPWTLQWYDNTGNIVGNDDPLPDDYPPSIEGQYSFLFDLIRIIKDVPNGKGTGLFYWAPEWISSPTFGSSWENVALFDFQGNVLSSLKVFKDVKTDTTNAVNDEINPVSDFILYQNYPNPFNPTTRIRYELKKQSQIKLMVFNSLGEQVNVLINEVKDNGKYIANWDGMDSNGNALPSGVYFIRLITDSERIHLTQTVKAILLR